MDDSTSPTNCTSGLIHDIMLSMKYGDAFREARKNAKSFPTTKDADGREWIEVNGRKFPKDWLIRHAARMKANGEI